jgi:hypothetical protein
VTGRTGAAAGIPLLDEYHRPPGNSNRDIASGSFTVRWWPGENYREPDYRDSESVKSNNTGVLPISVNRP